MDKKYYSGSVAVTTWRSSTDFNDLDCEMPNHRTDLIIFRDGVFAGVVLDPKNERSTTMSFDTKKKYTKKEITEAIVTAWDNGEYGDDQTDISLCY